MENPSNTELFFLLFDKYQTKMEKLSPKLKEFLRAVIKERSYRRKHLLLNADDVPLYSWFIVKGSARVYFYDPDIRREITTWFWYEGEWMLPLRTFFRQLESGECIELLQDSTLLLISAADMETMVHLFPEYRRFERILVEEHYNHISDHYHELLSMPSKSKFLKLIHTHKEIFNLAYLRDIACFLNMHPATLSRLRSGKG